MDTKTSELISAGRLYLILGLVFLHFGSLPFSGIEPYAGVTLGEMVVPSTINSMLYYIFYTSVPFLSIISGYLFFVKPNISFVTSLTKRAKSILLPYIIWTIIWAVAVYLLACVGSFIGAFPLPEILSTANIIEKADFFLGITQSPYAIQFWFLHDLILTLLLTPAIYWLTKTLKIYFVAAICIFWLAVPQAVVFFSWNVLVFFIIGSHLALNVKDINLSSRYAPIWAVVFITVVAVYVFNMELVHTILTKHIAQSVIRLVGVIAVYKVLVLCQEKYRGLISFLTKYSWLSFFIFCAHYPIINYIKLFAGKVYLLDNPIGVTLLLISIPVLSIILVWGIAIAGFKLLPSAFKLLNGGRLPA